MVIFTIFRQGTAKIFFVGIFVFVPISVKDTMPNRFFHIKALVDTVNTEKALSKLKIVFREISLTPTLLGHSVWASIESCHAKQSDRLHRTHQVFPNCYIVTSCIHDGEVSGY